MSRIKKLLPIFFLIIFLNNCGYTPRYAINKNLNFSIDVIEINGDREFNNFLKSKLVRYKNKKDINKKNYELNLRSSFTKKVKSKDAAGLAETYDLVISVETVIRSNSVETKKIVFEERFSMKKLEDAFEEKNYEKTVKENFSDVILERIIFYLYKL